METINVHKSNLDTFLERIKLLNRKLERSTFSRVLLRLMTSTTDAGRLWLQGVRFLKTNVNFMYSTRKMLRKKEA